MRALCMAAVAGMVFGLTGCGGGGPEAAMKDMIASTNEMATALESGDLTQIKAAAEKMKAVKEKHKNVKASDDQTKKLMETYGKELMGAAMKMGMAQSAAKSKMKTDEEKAELEKILASTK